MGDFYGYDPSDFKKDRSGINSAISNFSRLLQELPGQIRQNKEYQTSMQKFKDANEANALAYNQLTQMSQEIGIDTGIIPKPSTNQNSDEYISRGIATLFTAAESKGVDKKTILSVAQKIRGAGAVPMVQEQQSQYSAQQADLQQKQADVNRLKGEYGQPAPTQFTPLPQPTSILDSLQPGSYGGQDTTDIRQQSGVTNAAGGISGQGLGFQQPQVQGSILDALIAQHQSPANAPSDEKIPELRQLAISAGISGSQLDSMLNRVYADPKYTEADFRNEVATAMKASRTIKEEQTKERERLRNERLNEYGKSVSGAVGKQKMYDDSGAEKPSIGVEDLLNTRIGTEQYVPRSEHVSKNYSFGGSGGQNKDVQDFAGRINQIDANIAAQERLKTDEAAMVLQNITKEGVEAKIQSLLEYKKTMMSLLEQAAKNKDYKLPPSSPAGVTKVKPQQVGGVYKPRTQAEYDALDPGDVYFNVKLGKNVVRK